MSTFSRFEEIKAWQLARRLTKEVYELTKRDGFRQDGRDGRRLDLEPARGEAACADFVPVFEKLVLRIFCHASE